MVTIEKNPKPKPGDERCLHYYFCITGYLRCGHRRDHEWPEHTADGPNDGTITWDADDRGDTEFQPTIKAHYTVLIDTTSEYAPKELDVAQAMTEYFPRLLPSEVHVMREVSE